ncbi:TRAP transporter small permease [Amorphus sp. MBR-141]
MRSIFRNLERFSKGVDVIAGICLGVVTLLVFVSAIGRYLFSFPIPDSFDLSRLLLGVAVMWGLASIGFRGGHIAVDILAQVVPARVGRMMEAFGWAVLLVFTIALAYKLFERVDSAYNSYESTFDLRWPVWPWLALAWAGVVVSIFTVAARLLYLLTGADSPPADPDIHQPAESGYE